MAELLFIATTIFVAYVIFVVMGGKKDKPEPIKTEPPKVEPIAQSAPTEQAPPPPKAVKAAAKPAPAKTSSPKPAAKSSKSAASKVTETKPTVAIDSLKNPKTGEVAKIPASYAFAKRWIKDALVEEGLLDKVYKNNELDDAANAKIQAALEQIKSMDKYQ